MGASWYAAILIACWPAPAARPGLIFPLPESFETETVRQLAARVEEQHLLARKGGQEERFVLILDFNPDGRPTRVTNLDSCLALARMLQGLDRSKFLTVGWVAGDLSGHAVLPALACEELLMGARGTLGPAHEGDGEIDPIYKAAYEDAARRQGRSAIVARKLVDPRTSIRRDPDARGGADRFRDGSTFARGEVVVEAGAPGRFDRARALELGLCSGDAPANLNQVLLRHGIARDRLAVFSKADAPVVQVNLRGEITGALREKIHRDLRRAMAHKPELIVLNLECHGGLPGDALAAGEAARAIVTQAGPDGPRLIAYLTPQARGGALILALACDAVVFGKDARVGFEGASGGPPEIEQALARALAERHWLDAGSAAALASAMARPEASLLVVRSPDGPARLANAPAPAGAREEGLLKGQGEWMFLTAETASKAPLALSGPGAPSLRDWYLERGIGAARVAVYESSALDELALFLSHRGTTVFLVMIGLASLMVEFMKPGLAFPGVLAAICFVLVFWAGSRVSGQIDWLAVLLFILGVLLLLMEVVVIPGFGIVGLSGIVLMICALGLVALGHWPRSPGEWIAYGHAVVPFGWSIAGAIAIVALFFRFLPGIPVLNHLLLHPDRPAEQETAGTAIYEGERFQALLGQTGLATTNLRPAGIVRIDGALIDVVSDGTYIGSGSRVVVTRVEGNRVVVRQAEKPA